MSFRLFIYYCTLCGGVAAFLGWALGRVLTDRFPDTPGHLGLQLAVQGIKALFLGAFVAFALGLVDALWNLSWKRVVAVSLRVATALIGGGLGGLVGGVVSQLLVNLAPLDVFVVIGWALTGLLIGLSLGVFDWLDCVLRRQEASGATRKIRNGLIGGLAGGLLGGILSVLLGGVWGRFFATDRKLLWSPSAWGFVALGMCIGLLIGLAQVLLKEAWLRVEEGFRSGRELILTNPETTIGRAEGCALGLFGDPKVERVHARILRQGGRYVLDDLGGAAGTYLNGDRVREPRVLNAGDEIRLGRCVLRFGERQKRQ